MIEILKRDQIERQADEGGLMDPEFNPQDDIDEMFADLTPEERKLFESAIEDNSIIKQIESDVSYWWKSNFNVVPEDAPELKPGI